jgi:hypothetical protein
VYRDVEPFWKMVGPFFGTMVRPEGLLQLAPIVLLLLLAELAILLAPLIQISLLISWCMMVVVHASEGGESLPRPFEGGATPFREVILRLLAAGMPIWFTVAIVYLNFEEGVAYVVVGIAVIFYLPGAIIVAAIQQSLVEVVNPATTINLILRGRGEYVLVAVFWVAAVLFAVAVDWGFANTVGRLGVPIVVPFLGHAINLIVPTLAAFTLGRFIWQNGEVFGVMTFADRRQAQVVDPTPRAAFYRATAPERELKVSLELAADGPVGTAPSPEAPQSAGSESYALEDDDLPVDFGQARPGFDPDYRPTSLTLSAALNGGDPTQAVRIYRDLVSFGSPLRLNSADELRLADALSNTGDHSEAATMYQRIAETGGPVAADAVFGLALMLIERVERPDRGVPLLQEFLQQFPNHSRSNMAQKLIAQHS